jgi:hypothetical protein
MNFEALIGAAAVALTGSAAFALLGRSWLAVSRMRPGAGRFAGWIMPEAAQRCRDELDAVRRKQGLFITSAFLFAVLLCITYVLVPTHRFGDSPWQLAALVAILCVALVYAAWRLFRVVRARRRLEFVRDAAIAVGQGLQKLCGNLNRVFHEVPCGSSAIDNVVAGLHGVYAVHVVARRPGRHNKLRLQGERLLFAPGRYAIPLATFTEQSGLLARQLQKTLKLPLRVRTVIAVPGWEIEEQAGGSCLVVNERSLVMLRGWKDSSDYLMHEDVERLHELLTERCLRPTTVRASRA